LIWLAVFAAFALFIVGHGDEYVDKPKLKQD
jgi:hypothetical protein